jgi:flavodoxin
LLVSYSFRGQTQRVADVIADEPMANGCDVTIAKIEFTDPR